MTLKDNNQMRTTMLSPSGYRVLVGKNARDNDRLLAERHEAHALWFHAAARPGAHVFLEATSPATDADVAFAAALAGSGERGSAVTVASVWDVDKPKRAKHGLVALAPHATRVVFIK
jgi:predicted ribosome quality control (RQC) complex YloA/Tae2 family protein